MKLQAMLLEPLFQALLAVQDAPMPFATAQSLGRNLVAARDAYEALYANVVAFRAEHGRELDAALAGLRHGDPVPETGIVRAYLAVRQALDQKLAGDLELDLEPISVEDLAECVITPVAALGLAPLLNGKGDR